MVFPPFKYQAASANWLNTDPLVRPFARVAVPFPTETSPPVSLPAVAFNSEGQVIHEGQREPVDRDEIIPLAEGAVQNPRDANSRLLLQAAEVQLTPVNNFTNHYVRINWLTGRAQVVSPPTQ
jgi:hypothetical protein